MKRRLPAYCVFAETVSKDGTRVVSALFETAKRHEFDAIKHKIAVLAGEVVQRRACKKIKVVKVDFSRLLKFHDPKDEVYGTFDSTQAFALHIGANPASVRVALSKANADGIAKLRGVSFRYTE